MKKVSVQCRKLRLAYGDTPVLADLDLDVEPGEFFALLGPSGSGKSTLLRAIAGFARPQSGQLLVDGVDIGGQPPWQRQVGMVFQNYALWPHLTVYDNVAFGLVERRVDKAQIRRRVGAALETVGLERLADRRPGQLSGGQQQRVALARTIVIEPQVLLLDEPLSNLDKALRVQMRHELLALQRRLGLTTLFVTHDQEEAMSTADRMAVLDRGVPQQVGTPQALYDEPVNAFVAGFVGTMNLLPAQVLQADGQGTVLAVDGIGPVRVPVVSALPAGTPRLLGFRPAVQHLQPAAAPRDADCVWLGGCVEAAEFLGEFTRYRLRAGPHALAVDELRRGQGAAPAGTELAVGLRPESLRLLAP